MTDNANVQHSDILRSAWKRYAELNANGMALTKKHKSNRQWAAILGVVATVLAVFIDQYGEDFADIVQTILKVTLIAVPIIISGLAAYRNRFFGGGEWLTLRAAAEEILKEIYVYRTILQGQPARDKWLSHRLTTILRRVYKSMGGQLVLEPYEGQLPPYYNPADQNSDPGFNDLTGDEYLRYRLIDQRDWHRNKITSIQLERKRIQWIILGMGGIGALFAGLGGVWVAWVAVTAAIASAYTGWEQLRALDETIAIYSRVILELTILRDQWESTPSQARGFPHLVTMVRTAEGVMWAQSQKYVATMQDALAAAEGDDAKLVEDMINKGNETLETIQEKMIIESTEVLAHTQARVLETVDMAGDTAKRIVDSAAGEAQAYAALAEESAGKVIDESAAYRATAAAAVDTVMDQSAEIRASVGVTVETVAADMGAMTDTVQAAVVDESAALRGAVEATVDHAAQEVSQIRAGVEQSAGMVIDEAGAMGDAVSGIAADAAAEMGAMRETLETSAGEVLAESAELREAIENTTDTVVSESQQVRELLGAAEAEPGVQTMLDDFISQIAPTENPENVIQNLFEETFAGENGMEDDNIQQAVSGLEQALSGLLDETSPDEEPGVKG
jgi:hypothetical protein